MKTFNQFCEDANINEFWNPFAPKPKPKPKGDVKVLAYQNNRPGELNKTTGELTQRSHTPAERARYGWEPVKVSAYSKADTPGKTTASGHRFDDNQRLVAVPYRSRTDTRASIPHGTNIELTQKPTGATTKIARTSVQDTGNFGRSDSESTNPKVKMDLSLRTAQDVTGQSGTPVRTSTAFGKRIVYRRFPDKSNPYVAPHGIGPVLK